MRARPVAIAVLTLVVAALAGCSASAGNHYGGLLDQSVTPYPGGRWSPPQPTFGASVETDVEIEMSDGVVLVGDVTYPVDPATGRQPDARFPVLLSQNPYGEEEPPPEAEFFVSRGYIFASVDVRGTARSGGTQVLFEPRAADDGAELVRWAAALPGGDGAVGLWGCSYLGINQLETATRLGADSPVKAMIPACLSSDLYRNALFDNGIPSPAAQAWPGIWSDVDSGGDTGYVRDYWTARDLVARANDIHRTGIPVLLWTGWQEGGSAGALDLYAALQNLEAGRAATVPMDPDQPVSGKYQVVIGDWQHGEGLDQGIQLQWYDTWIKGIDTGLPTDTATPLHLEEIRSGRWVNAPSYPIVDSYTPLYLSHQGSLLQVRSGTGQSQLTWTPPGEQATSIDFTTEPFTDGAVVAGPMAAQLHVTSSNANLQLLVEVLDRAPDGTTARITHGSILGSRRNTDADRSWADAHGVATRPYLTLDTDEPMVAAYPTAFDVPLRPTVWAIEPGHRIVVRISTHAGADDCDDAITVQEPVGCVLTKPMRETLPGGRYTIHHNADLSSSVNLPLLPYGALSTAGSGPTPTTADEEHVPNEW